MAWATTIDRRPGSAKRRPCARTDKAGRIDGTDTVTKDAGDRVDGPFEC